MHIELLDQDTATIAGTFDLNPITGTWTKGGVEGRTDLGGRHCPAHVVGQKRADTGHVDGLGQQQCVVEVLIRAPSGLITGPVLLLAGLAEPLILIGWSDL